MAKQFTTSIYREPVKKRTSIGRSVRSRPKNKNKSEVIKSTEDKGSKINILNGSNRI